MNLQEGTRIYHTGDMANMPGHGTITTVERNERWGDRLEITMDDGRSFWLTPSAFSEEYAGNCSTRFVLESAYQEWRRARIARIRGEMWQGWWSAVAGRLTSRRES